jgi:Cupin domain
VFFAITGRVRLSLGERDITVQAGESAEFSTMTPHAITAVDGPAELIMIFDRDGQRAHVHRETAGPRPKPDTEPDRCVPPPPRQERLRRGQAYGSLRFASLR